jgi:CelD/BcsL family acetyltransferase involved in cellulose biosynthesis
MKAKQISDVLAETSTLRVIEIDPQNDPRWEAFMRTMPAATLIYHPVWLKALEKIYGHKTVHLACEDTSTGQVVGILPLFNQRGLRSGHLLRSMYTGPLALDDQITTVLAQAAVERARAEAGVQLRLRVMSNAPDGMLDGMVGEPLYEVFVLTLPEKLELLRLDSSIKRAINKATRSGVEIRQAQTERELRAWYELYLQTMRKFAALPNPYSYYKRVWRQLHASGMIRLLLAEHVEAGNRRLLGGIFLLLYDRTVSFITAAWREEDQALRPSDALHWRAIQDACKEGFRWYDFGDVDLENEGLARYKRKWGAEAKMVYGYNYPLSPAGTGSADGVPSNPTRKLAHAAWKYLPDKTIGLLSDWYYALRLY